MRIRARLEAAEIRGMQVLQAERDLLLGMAASLQEQRLLEGDVLDVWLARVGRVPDYRNCPNTAVGAKPGESPDSGV
jgi:hypothetical protein